MKTKINYSEISNFESTIYSTFESNSNYIESLKELILKIKSENPDYSIQIFETKNYIKIYFLDLEFISDFEYTQNYINIKKDFQIKLINKYI